MSVSIFLARVLGLWVFIGSLAVLIKPKIFDNLLREINRSTGFFYLTAFFSLLAGILIIAGHNIWSGWPVLITIIGWLAFIRGIVRIFFAEHIIKLLNWWLDNRTAWFVGCIVGLLIGIYLLYFGFIAS